MLSLDIGLSIILDSSSVSLLKLSLEENGPKSIVPHTDFLLLLILGFVILDYGVKIYNAFTQENKFLMLFFSLSLAEVSRFLNFCIYFFLK